MAARARFRYRIVVVALTAAVLVSSSGCRSEAGAKRGVRTAHLSDVRGYLEFTARDRRRDQRSKISAQRQESKERILEEAIELETDGYVYHPNLLEFTLAGLFGLRQFAFEETYDQRSRTSSEDGTILEFDLDGEFFKKKPYPGSVYARRHRSLTARPFQSSLETTTTSYGVVWQYVSEKTPTSLQFNHTKVELDSLDKTEEDGLQENTQFRFETAYRFSSHNELSFLYDRQSLKEEPFTLKYDTDELTLSHRLDFGEHYAQRLDSELNYFDQRGTFQIKRSRWREILRLKHSESLRSWYQFEAMKRKQGSLSGVPPIDETSFYLTGTVEHQLYESLVTQLFGFGHSQEYQSGLKIKRYGAQISFDYRKKNPWGLLLAGYRARVQREDRTGAGMSFEIIDERKTFHDPEPERLSNRNAVISSLFVTAEDRTTVYRIGDDYIARRIGDEIELERVPTGRIEDGQTVLVDYVYFIGSDFTLDTVAQDFNIRQNFDFGLSPYYRLRWQRQTLNPVDATGVTPEDITAHILGVEYKKGPFRLMAEYEDHDSNINPFEAYRFSADYTHRFPFAATLSAKAKWTDVSQKAPFNRDTTFFTIEGRYRHPVTRQLTLEGMVLYRNQKDSLSGDDEGIDVDLSLEWIVRQTEVRVTYEYSDFEDDFAKNNASTLFVQVRRRF